MQLLISTQPGRNLGLNAKMPGLALAKALQASGVATLLDVPSCLYRSGLIGHLQVLKEYSIQLIKFVFQAQRGGVYFYNLPKAYLPFYLVYVFTRFQRPNLLLADGINCTGLQRFGNQFFNLFLKVVSLPYYPIQAQLKPKHQLYWFPGSVPAHEVVSLSPKPTTSQPIRLLYNSNLLAHNHPEQLLALAQHNPSVRIVVTETQQVYQQFVQSTCQMRQEELPVNLEFVGKLDWQAYLALCKQVTGLLLIRDEANFANQYNFPSKVLEAYKMRMLVVSTYPISGVPAACYVYCEHSDQLEEKCRQGLPRVDPQAQAEFNAFVKQCCPLRLKAWLEGQALNGS